jgi:hypothetical protein
MLDGDEILGSQDAKKENKAMVHVLLEVRVVLGDGALELCHGVPFGWHALREVCDAAVANDVSIVVQLDDGNISSSVAWHGREKLDDATQSEVGVAAPGGGGGRKG